MIHGRAVTASFLCYLQCGGAWHCIIPVIYTLQARDYQGSPNCIQCSCDMANWWRHYYMLRERTAQPESEPKWKKTWTMKNYWLKVNHLVVLQTAISSRSPLSSSESQRAVTQELPLEGIPLREDFCWEPMHNWEEQVLHSNKVEVLRHATNLRNPIPCSKSRVNLAVLQSLLTLCPIYN